jgi:hypothetical protein
MAPRTGTPRHTSSGLIRLGEELLSFYEERQLTFSPSIARRTSAQQPFRDKNLNLMLGASDAKNATQDRYRLQNFCA